MPSRAQRARRAGAGIAGLIACATLFPATASAAEQSVSAGDMDWGYKETWRNYITGFQGPGSQGTITASDGATENEDESFNFPNATGTYDSDGGAAAIAYEGSVNFAKPAHGINITMANPQIVIDGPTGSVLADMTSGSDPTEQDVELATLDLSAAEATQDGDTVTYTDIPAAASEEGMDYFTYEAGTELDPVSTSFTVADEPEPVDPSLGLKVAPKNAKVRQGGVKTFRAIVTADEGPTRARVCARVPSGKRGLKLIGPRCKSVDDVYEENTRVAFKVRAKGKTNPKRFRLNFTAAAQGYEGDRASASLKVQRKKRR